jgi:hypothetical protein
MAHDKLLLVEGEADRGFFEQLCKALALDTQVTDIKVATPKDVGGYGRISRLGCIVDADYASEGGLGFAGTRAQLSAKLTAAGFTEKTGAAQAGLLFGHEDFHDVGCWIMPDNQNEGMLEDWLCTCRNRETEQTLIDHATTAISDLPETRFKDIHRSKAEIATWLAWQKTPGHGYYEAIRAGLLDTNHPAYLALCGWLEHLYR